MNFKKFLMTALSTGTLLSVMAVSAFAEGSGSGTEGGMNIMSLIFIPLVLVLMYFMLIRPQKKRDKQAKDMREAIKVGDEIVTIGGICGKVTNVKDETITIVSAESKMTFLKTAVASVTTPDNE